MIFSDHFINIYSNDAKAAKENITSHELVKNKIPTKPHAIKDHSIQEFNAPFLAH